MRQSPVAVLTVAALALVALPAAAQDPMPPPETLEGGFPAQKHYSP